MKTGLSFVYSMARTDPYSRACVKDVAHENENCFSHPHCFVVSVHFECRHIWTSHKSADGVQSPSNSESTSCGHGCVQESLSERNTQKCFLREGRWQG